MRVASPTQISFMLGRKRMPGSKLVLVVTRLNLAAAGAFDGDDAVAVENGGEGASRADGEIDGAAFDFALQAPGADQLGGGGEVGGVGLIAGRDGRREYRREIGFLYGSHHHGGDGEIGFTCRSRLH